MISVLTPCGADGFELCQPRHAEDFETLNTGIAGNPRSQDWSPIEMRLVRKDRGRTLRASDAPWLGSHALIFRRAAARKLEDALLQYGELLPLKCTSSREELLIFNVTRVVDALDEQHSTITRFSSGRIMAIDRFAFKEGMLEGVDVFKIPDLRVSPTFVSSRFVERWSASGLTGLDFLQVWPSVE